MLKKLSNNPSILNIVNSYLSTNDAIAFNNAIKTTHVQQKILIRGQIQSGKTGRIIQYIKETINNKLPTILCIQNSLSMLSQYEKALKSHNIHHHAVNSPNYDDILEELESKPYNSKPYVILMINNVYRKNIMNSIVEESKLTRYSCIIDESDMCYDEFRYTKLYKNAQTVIHVTATPYLRAYNNYFNQVIDVNISPNYVGIKDVEPKFIEENESGNYNDSITKIVKEDFANLHTSMMLINVYSTVDKMHKLASHLMGELESAFVPIPVIVISTDSYVYHNKKQTPIKSKLVSNIITEFNNYPNVILIAHRLANRGINYVNNDYSRSLTHQITTFTGTKTAFLQKCRLFGNKTFHKKRTHLYIIGCNETKYAKTIEKLHVPVEKLLFSNQ